ncbi:carboxyl transferase domain-containing protein [Phenylobacterium sp. SCN 70-31]|uniref:carboxyl transferase domain-containing protein n=1 Tax=Phenylobacterium sp. SCN 70-31 TaxID=1660129 RepID=UPI0008696ECB|nr:carboxyl transferase domain-containing protein [Phenylobacterium sp. SCN 70-31]ODT89907.1 MAG: carbamoyl-phosphate synthase large subunit [Phenylobacterium sp. SCN 70-31]
MEKLLIANRGEIAIRIARTAARLGLPTVAVHSEDDARALHVRRADEAVALSGVGPAAYLDAAGVLAAAAAAGADAVHPGYGFLSESAAFARACRDAGLTFVGPEPETLDAFGDKAAARQIARHCGVATLDGTQGPTSLAEAAAFLRDLGPGGAVMVKAVAGGGGRGMRPVERPEDLAAAYERCASEALSAFGVGDLYVERLMPRARHIEVQILGDGSGRVIHLWDRDCSVQRQRQKIVELAPARGLDPAVRLRLLEAAVELGRAVRYRGVGTIEFLVEPGGGHAFIEANARLQVEHTVTEAVTGLDLVDLQLAVASGRSLADLGLADGPPPVRGVAVQARVNLERMADDGTARPAAGVLAAYEPPSGAGVRVDGFGYTGYATSVRFDSLLAKVIVHDAAGDQAALYRAADRALAEFRIEGAPTNIPFLRAILRDPVFVAGDWTTALMETRAGQLAAAAELSAPSVNFELDASGAADTRAADVTGPPGTQAVEAPLQGTVVSLAVAVGAEVRANEPVAVLEAMKMEHLVAAGVDGVVRLHAVAVGDTVSEGQSLVFVEPADLGETAADDGDAIDLDHVRPDLREVLDRHDLLLDVARPEAVAKRRKLGFRTARENVDDLCDPGSFVEYGGLVIAGRRLRNPVEELIRTTPADGMVTGVGRVNGDIFGPEASRCVVMSYDYMVLAGTQGMKNHEKTDRLFELAEKWRLPVIYFSESGGGRPGDTDRVSGGGIFNVKAFMLQGRLSALVPQIGITNGRCFAGAAVLLGCCDVIIATEGSTIGVGGPAVIEGGGLGVYTPDEVGPLSVQVPGGVVDIVVRDEAEAVEAAKRYLSYFQGRLPTWSCADQRRLRHLIPENRVRVYDIREVIETLADEGTVLELRKGFGLGMVTALARIEGRPVGIIANNPAHLGGAVDSEAADKAARFMQLCDAFDIPLVVLADTPGNMVGPEAEKTGLIRHCCRMFVTGPNLTVPVFTIVLRKGYGLGILAMAGGCSHASFFTIAWPSGEFGGMNLEGSVKLGYRKELEAIADPEEREAAFQKMVTNAYEQGKALNVAMGFDFDDVIDPAETRTWIVAGLESTPIPRREGKKRPFIDTW